ncbi:MAG: flagellar biosynthetic protein FliR [Phycisphaerae bacterium]|jgi:flagellar biosynthesis protein FliR|nr:flagellar biosynthetic protein FliR [Phycisphaerae bacterium]MBT6282109.1 flagellar biosynthetic protein FliR [Phycisphaerae bacterium]
MSELTHTTLFPLLAVIARIAGLAIIAPVFGSPAIPKIVRGAIVVTLGFSAWTMASIAPIQEASLVGLGVVLVGEFAIGAAIGFFMALPLVAVQMGGSMMGQQMSIALPSMLDPATGGESDELGRGFMMFALVGFVVVGGIEQTYLATVGSFSHLPAASLASQSIITTLTGLLDVLFEFGFRVALPLVAILMLQTAALAMVARSMPQLNIFSVGLPLRILVGLMVLVAGLGIIGTMMSTFMPDMVGSVSEWATGVAQ